MGKFLTIWTQSPTAPWPTDPAEALKLNEMLWATVEGLLKKGEITDFGWFMDRRSGYAIGEGDSVTVFKNVNMFSTYFDMTVEEQGNKRRIIDLTGKIVTEFFVE